MRRIWIVVAAIASVAMSLSMGQAQDHRKHLVDEGEPGISIWEAPLGTALELTLRRDGEIYCQRAGIVPDAPNAGGARVFTACRIADADFGGPHTWEVEVIVHGTDGTSQSSGRVQMEVDEVPGGCFPSVTLGAPSAIIIQGSCG
ncbi:MAG: hypothetical protein H6842_00525 [Rhodospirillaceae bacterium]|nr:hypothetical protein [Rhodospirillaceae bacterium]